MKTVQHLPKAAVFEEFLRHQGELTILWPTGRTVHSVNEDVDVIDYRLLLDGNEIGIYSEISEAGALGRLRELRFKGRIPEYRTNIAGEEQEEIMLICATLWGQGYTNYRLDGHRSIPFHYSRN